MTDESQHPWSDAWLLLAIIYAGKTSAASLRDIISAGDYINHAIFTYDELATGLKRLAADGLIIDENGNFRPSESTVKSYKHTTTPRRSALKEVEDIYKFIVSQTKVESIVSSNISANLSETEYDNAVHSYLDNLETQ